MGSGGGGAGRLFEEKKSRTEFCPKKYLGQGKFYCTYMFCIIYNISRPGNIVPALPISIKWPLPNTGTALNDSSAKGGRVGKWAPAHWGHEK